MLVLARSMYERVALMQNGKVIAWVSVVEFRKGKFRIGFDADKEVKIWREELLGRASAPVEPIKEEQSGLGQDAPILEIAP